ncbi:MAG: hypothetical protein U0667_00455 [Chloroflexota bacterium]
MADAQRLPSPGPSFIREERVTLASRADDAGEVVVGLTAPSVMDDGWWLTHLWAQDAAGVVSARDAAPVAGPPAGPPLLAMGPILAGALAGLIDQEDGRQLIRLRMPPPADESRPWERPLLLMTAIRWDPIRAATMRPNELARELLRAFARATEAVGAPGRVG